MVRTTASYPTVPALPSVRMAMPAPRVLRRLAGHIFAIAGSTVSNGRIVEVDMLADPQRPQRIDVAAISD